MVDALKTLALRLALCALLGGLAWRVGGALGVLFVTPLFGIAVARPLLELASAIRHEMRRANWRELEGHRFAFRGRTVHVLEDVEHRRWVRLADVRAIVGVTASDAALRLTYPDGWSVRGKPAEPHLSDEALLEHLAKERSPAGAALCRWVEKEIVFPAQRQRERLGIRTRPRDAGDEG